MPTDPPTSGETGDLTSVRESFDGIAEAYATAFVDELAGKPFDRELLEELVAGTRPGGSALDLGCGAGGHIGRYLADRGLRVTGVDFSERSIGIARRLNPSMSFVVADIRELPFPDASAAAITAFYCLIYGTEDDVVAALSECRRVLEPGGRLLAAVHGGQGSERWDDFRGRPIDVTVRYTSVDGIRGMAERAGLSVEDVVAREPYPTELATQRIYLRARA